MTNDWWNYESKETYNSKLATSWANKAKSDAFNYLAPTQLGVPDAAVNQSPDNLFAPAPLITNQDKAGKSNGGFFKGIENIPGDIYHGASDLLRPVGRVLQAENDYIARPIAKLALSPFGDYDHLPGIVRAGAETLANPLTYIGPGAVMDAFKVARIAPELKLAAPTLQSLFDSAASRRLLIHAVKSAGFGLASVGGGEVANQLGVPSILGAIPAQIIAGRGLNRLGGEPTAMHVARPDLTEPEDVGFGVQSKFTPVNTLNYGKGEGALTFRRGKTEMLVTKYPVYPLDNKPAMIVSIERQGATSADFKGRMPGGDIKSLLEVRDVLGDVAQHNPNTSIFAFPSDERRRQLYIKAGFDPYINKDSLMYQHELANGVAEPRDSGYLILNRDRFFTQRANDVKPILSSMISKEDSAAYDKNVTDLAFGKQNSEDAVSSGMLPTDIYTGTVDYRSVSPRDLTEAKRELSRRQGVLDAWRTGRLGQESPDLKGQMVERHYGLVNEAYGVVKNVQKQLDYQNSDTFKQMRAASDANRAMPTEMGAQFAEEKALTEPPPKPLDAEQMFGDSIRKIELMRKPSDQWTPADHQEFDAILQRHENNTNMGQWPSSRIVSGSGNAQPRPYSFLSDDSLDSRLNQAQNNLDSATTSLSNNPDMSPERRATLEAAVKNRQKEVDDYYSEVYARRGSKLPGIGGAGAGSNPAIQGIMDNVTNLSPEAGKLINATSDLEVKDAQLKRASNWTVQGRAKLGAALDSWSYTKNLADLLRSYGVRFEDTNATANINEANRILGLGSGHANAMGDHQGTFIDRANDIKRGAVLKTSYKPDVGTIVNDKNIQSMAREAELHGAGTYLQKDGSLRLSDLGNAIERGDIDPVTGRPAFENLSKDQLAHVEAMAVPMRFHKELEGAFNVDNQGDLFHEEPITDKTVRRGVNVAQNFQRPMGELAGEKGWLPFAEAQSARVNQGYHAIANNWLNASLEGLGKTSTQLIPAEIVKGLNDTHQLLNQGTTLQSRITEALTGKTFTSPEFKPINQELDDARFSAEMAAVKTNPAERQAALQDALNQVNNVLKPATDAKAMYDSVRNEIEHGIGSKYTEGLTAGPGNKFYPTDVGEQLNRYNADTSPKGITKAVIDLNNQVRPIMASLDYSFMGVQGLVAALSNPFAWGKAMMTLTSNAYGDYENSIRSSGRLQAMINDGVHWASRHDMGEFLTPRSIQKLPVVGGLYTGSNSLFTRFGNVLRSELYNSVDWEAIKNDPIKRASLARSVNLMTGFSPNNPSNLESAISFAPRFFRSQMGLIADGITKHDFGPMGAARSLGTMMISGIALTTAANEILGNKTDFNPESPNFLRVRVGGQDVAIFGTWDTLARAFTKFTQTGNPLVGAEYLARAKASPVLSKVYDVMTGSMLDGTKLSWGSPGDLLNSAANEAASLGPISATQVLTHPGDLTDPGAYAAKAINFMGTKATPLSPSENMQIQRDSLAQKVYGKPGWDNLEPYQQAKLHTDYKLDLPAKSDIARAFEFQRDISKRYQTLQENIDGQLPVGKDWIDAYHTLNNNKTGAFAEWLQEHPDAAAKIKQGVPKDANEAALHQFFNVFDQADKQHWSPDELTQNLDNFQSSITPAQQDYVNRNTGLHDTPRVQEYKAAQKVLRPYWDIQDQVYDRLKGRLPNSESASSLQEYTDNLVQEMQNAGVPDQIIAQRIKANPVLAQIQRATSQLRERYRQTHKDADRLLGQWYGYSKAGA